MPAHRLPNRKFNWKPSLAYAIGLITTDGSLSKDGRHITFTSTDIGLIETFKGCLELKNRITKASSSAKSKKQCFRVQFGGVQFYNWLMRIGLKPNKSLFLGNLLIPNKFFPDFLRGHLDGDGSVFTYVDRYNTFKNPKYVYNRLYVYLTSASKEHIEWIQATTIKLKNLKGAIQKGKLGPKKHRIYVLKFSKKESIEFLNWIYYQLNLPCLKRKYEVAKPFLKNT